MISVIRSVAGPLAVALAAFATGGAAGAGWSIEATANPTVTSLLSGVSCSSPHACTAVGSFQTGTGAYKTLAERWNGRKWTRQPTPNPAGLSPVLVAVSCPRAGDCVAVGSTGDGLKTLAERWNGTRWNVAASGTGGPGWLNGVSCSSPDTCMAVGSTGIDGALAERWNGTRWVVQHLHSPAGNSGLTSVSCPTQTDCTAVGYSSGGGGTFAERWNGHRWSLQATKGPTGFSFLYGVSCTSPGACIATGYYETGAGTDKTLAERWNGRTWKVLVTPRATTGLAVNLAAVSCAGPSDCTATGYYDARQGRRVLAEHWNGHVWAVQRTPNPKGTFTSQLDGVSCPSPAGCQAAGSYMISASQKTLAERYDA